MRRYIDADKLCRDVLASWRRDRHNTIEASRVHRQEHNHLRLIIEKQPTADVIVVRHGHWIDVCTDTIYRYECSLCGNKRIGIETNYCCNCGAKMDGERK